MIDVWFKIRQRNTKEWILKHLNSWLFLFADPSKYRLYLYNEDVHDLPEDYRRAFQVLNKPALLQNQNVVELFRQIDRSKLSRNWVPAAQALLAPYYYLNDSEYLINIDADDILLLGDAEHYILQALQAVKDFNLPIISYDYILSENFFDICRKGATKKSMIPNHWSFSVAIAPTQKFRHEIIEPVIKNSEKYYRLLPDCKLDCEYNVDIAISTLLKHERGDKYIAFITKEGFYHNGFNPVHVFYHSCLTENNRFSWQFNEHKGQANLHPKTLIIR